MRRVHLFLFVGFFSILFLSSSTVYDDFVREFFNSNNLSTNLINDLFVGEYSVVREFETGMCNFVFSKKNLNVEYGQKVRIKLVNINGFHNFVIEELGVSSDILATGEVEYLEFIVTKRRKFKFYSFYGDAAMKDMTCMLYVE
jgi:heme/copper-type cytochrome/quinol oxidase subunit 2